MARKIDKLHPLTAKQKESMQKRNTKLVEKYDPTKKKTPAAPSTVAQLAKRLNVTAREARDVVTALSTVASRRILATYKDPAGNKKDFANVKKQIKEVGTAAKTGKRGTTSDIEGRKYERDFPGSGRYGTDRTYGYETGKQRGKGGKVRKLSQ